MMQLVSHSHEQTRDLGKVLGELARGGDVFLLVGNLGAGKTCLTQGIAWGLGINEYTASPSFVIVREYQGRLPLYHMDLYRLENVAEIADLGLDEYFSGSGVSVVEWADRAMAILPEDNLTVVIEHLGAGDRLIKLQAKGDRYLAMVRDLESMLERGSGKWNWL